MDNPLEGLNHPLEIAYRDFEPERVKELVESRFAGTTYRLHIDTCERCAAIIRELYDGGEIPQHNNTPDNPGAAQRSGDG